MNRSGAIAKSLAVATLFISLFLICIPQLGFAQETGDTPNIIGSRIWCDDNRDGILNNGEKIPNVTVKVTGDSTGFSGTEISDENGNYKFTDLPADTFTVEVVTSTLPSTCNQLISEGPDSTFVRFEGAGAVITKSIGPLDNMTSVYLDDLTHRVNAEQNFGYEPPPGIVPGTGSIGNYIWCDADLSGDATNSFTSTSTGLPVFVKELLSGVNVELTNADGYTLTTTTNDDGSYLFSDLGVGPYTVKIDESTLPPACNIPAIDPDGGTPHIAQVNVDRGETGQGDEKLGVDFSYQPAQPLGAAIGTVWCDLDKDMTRDSGEGVADAVLTMESTGDAGTFTDISLIGGRFIFMNLPAGDYTLSVDQSSLPDSCGEPLTDMRDSAGNPTSVVAVSGSVQELAASGAELEIGFEGTLPVNDLGGRIWCDDLSANGQYDDREALTGVLVTVTGTGGNKFSKATSVGGIYKITSLIPDTYTVEVDTSTITGVCTNPIGDSDGTLDNMTIVTLTGESDQLSADFIYSEVPVVATPVITPTEEVTPTPEATPTPETTPTPEETPTPEVTETSEPTAEPTSEPTSEPTDEPTATPDIGPATVAGVIWDDANGNGVQDDNEVGLAGVSVALYDSEGTILSSVNTDAKGIYEIRANEPGDYYITIVVPEEFAITSSDEDIDAITGRSMTFALADGQTKSIGALGISQSPEGTEIQPCPDGGCLYFLPSMQ